MTATTPRFALIDRLVQGPNRPRVIFCDWHGVLCQKPYWHSITDDSNNPLHAILAGELDRLFTAGNRNGRDWMRGLHTSHDILRALADRHTHLDVDELLARLVEDIARMPVDQPLLQTLRHARAFATIVLATDNIDTFTTTFRDIQNGRVSAGTDPEVLSGVVSVFDDILSSSELGVLKSENSQTFFGPWLRRAGLSFADALLIDDREDNCIAFERHSGAALQWGAV
ncbi:hypothetical protein ACFWPH_27885 [Nocardia sp. NPDC058499]|uniref:hypothetical protein n=1 Tax=Nocardia sp. NPDC058499 TaxID=3346530 RepID=UPI00365E6946